MTQAQQLPLETLRELHPGRLSDRVEVESVLQRLQRNRVVMRAGMNRKVQPEEAFVSRILPASLIVDVHGFEPRSGEIFFNFELAGRNYLAASELISAGAAQNGWTKLEVSRPRELFLKERRGRLRAGGEAQARNGWRVRMVGLEEPVEGTVVDLSDTGIGLAFAGDLAVTPGAGVTVRFLSGEREGEERTADVRYARSTGGSTRVGARLQADGFQGEIPIQEMPRILPATRAASTARRVRMLTASIKLALSRAVERAGLRRGAHQSLNVVHFADSTGHEIVGLIDAYLGDRPPTAVIVPPAWGRTKETLLPLAKTIVAIFQAAGEPVVVLRFDGVRKRGESFNDPESGEAGAHHRFTISQGVRDIQAAQRFVTDQFSPSKTVLVTFSAGGIDARAALARDAAGSLDGWVCVVGPSDLQSALSVISGGIDYVGGGERGVKFGFREILGVEMDIDLANSDAYENGLAFLEDACRDFDSIDVPITWLHGAHDAWMDIDRVRHALSHGRQDNRKLLVVPTGHQLRTSREAIETFQLIGQEVSEISLGIRLSPEFPDFSEIDSIRVAERSRLPVRSFDPGEFWRRYLLGREGRKGMDLMLETPTYLRMIRRQIDLLELRAGMTVLDLGCGTGVLVSQLAESRCPPLMRVICVDLVVDALRRVVHRGKQGGAAALTVEVVATNLSGATGDSLIPVADESVDVVIGSLLLSYVEYPEVLLRAMYRVLRPGGRVLVSSLRQDADFSKIWVQDEKVLRTRARETAASGDEEAVEQSLQSFLNDAARVLDLEESGVFRFWDPEELAGLVEAAGFRDVATERALGDPPQAVIVSGRR